MKYLLLFFVFLNFMISQDFKLKTEQLINQYYNLKSCELKTYKLKKQEIDALEKLSFRFNNNNFLYFTIQNNNKKEYVIIDDVMGKSHPITYLVIVNEDEIIKYVEVIEYRNIKGNAVTKRRWLDKFIGLFYENEKLNNKVDGISGATISANSITKGITKILYFIKNYKSNLSE